MLLAVQTPVPRDIPLDLPLPEWALVTLLVVSFLLHILFINLMVGGSIITLWAEIRGLKDKEYDTFAHEVAKTITVNKSLAVVLGVAPLLSINALYTIYFYSANALTGMLWIMIIPLVILAFLLTYLHKYTWEALENAKRVHIAILALAVLVFLFIPFIFLTNVNLMMFPDKWGYVKGFVSALMLPNVFPRYLEFIGGTLTLTGIFIVGYNMRKRYHFDEIYSKFTRNDVKKLGYGFAFIGLILQLFFGAVVLITLPSRGMGYGVLAMMLIIAGILALTLWYVFLTISGKDESKIDLHFKKIVYLLASFLILYGSSRQMYRDNALQGHQKLMAIKTKEFEKRSKEAREHPAEPAEPEVDASLGEYAKGAAIFKQNCSSCHQKDTKLVGPPMLEMVSIYKDDQQGMKNWIKKPGKKRPDFPQMPGFSSLSEEDLNELTNYVLNIEKQ